MAAVSGPSQIEAGSGILPAFDGIAITPSDSTNLATVCRALFIGVAGNVKLRTPASTSLEFLNCQAGSILPVQCILVFATSTTANNIVGLV